ncbi:MAG: hypothetical protein JTJ20_15130 [Blautia sp.]|nr:hypothetical protein [Blautia sp.]
MKELLDKRDAIRKDEILSARSDPSHRGMITGISVENFHPGALTVGVISGILNELYEQTCRR